MTADVSDLPIKGHHDAGHYEFAVAGNLYNRHSGGYNLLFDANPEGQDKPPVPLVVPVPSFAGVEFLAPTYCEIGFSIFDNYLDGARFSMVRVSEHRHERTVLLEGQGTSDGISMWQRGMFAPGDALEINVLGTKVEVLPDSTALWIFPFTPWEYERALTFSDAGTDDSGQRVIWMPAKTSTSPNGAFCRSLQPQPGIAFSHQRTMKVRFKGSGLAPGTNVQMWIDRKTETVHLGRRDADASGNVVIYNADVACHPLDVLQVYINGGLASAGGQSLAILPTDPHPVQAG